MSNDKIQPTHRISFSEKQSDDRGNERLGAPTEVATVWPRKNGKQGGIIQWHISPEKLGNNGVYFMLDNERQQSQANERRDGFDQAEPKAPHRGSSRGR